MLDAELPLLVVRNEAGFGDHLREVLARIGVIALFTVLFYPGKRLLVLLRIIDADGDSPENFRHIHPFGSHAQVFLQEIHIYDTSGNSHGDRTDVDIGLVLHNTDRNSASGEVQDLLGYIFRDSGIVLILYFRSVDREGRQPSLRIGRHDCGKIYGARSFCPVKSPNRFDCIRV